MFEITGMYILFDQHGSHLNLHSLSESLRLPHVFFLLCLVSSRTSGSKFWDVRPRPLRTLHVPRAIRIPAPHLVRNPLQHIHPPIRPTPAHARSSNDLRPSASGIGGGGARGGGGAETPADDFPIKGSTPGQPLLLDGKLLV